MNTSNESKPWNVLLFNSFIGLIFMLINFPKLLSKAIRFYVDDIDIRILLLDIVGGTQEIIQGLAGNNPERTFQDLISYSFIGFWIYIALLILFSLRHGSLSLFGLGILGLFIGIASLHVISWIALIIVWILYLLGLIINFLVIILAFIFKYGIWIAIIGGAIYLIYAYWEYIVKYFIRAMIALGVGYFLYKVVYKVVSVIWEWFINLIRPILDFIAKILGFLLIIAIIVMYIGAIVIGILGILSTLGHLVIDQIRSAWHAGNGRKGVMLGAFSIGTALALIFLTSVANPSLANRVNYGWNESWYIFNDITGLDITQSQFAQINLTRGYVQIMPASVREFVFENLDTASAPLYDTFLLLVVLVVSYMGILRNISQRLEAQTEVIPVTFYPDEYFAIFGGLILQVALIFIAALSEGNNS